MRTELDPVSCSRHAAARLLRRPRPRTPEPTTPQLALAVWPVANAALNNTFLDGSRHLISPELAALAVLAYSDPGDLVLDPDCHSGSTLVEAIRHGRHAIGLTTNTNDGAVAVANISRAREQGAPGRAAVLTGKPTQLPRLLHTAQPILDTRTSGRARRHPAGSSRLILTAPGSKLATQLPCLRSVLAPGGYLLLIIDRHSSDTPVRLTAAVTAAEDHGFHYWQHVIALKTTPQTTAVRAVLLHTDVLAFRKPTALPCAASGRQAVSA